MYLQSSGGEQPPHTFNLQVLFEKSLTKLLLPEIPSSLNPQGTQRFFLSRYKTFLSTREPAPTPGDPRPA